MSSNKQKRKEIYFPPYVAQIINEFLGKNYWGHRKLLTQTAQAMDFITGSYGSSCWWLWGKWRSKYANNWYIDMLRFCQKPDIPRRVLNRQCCKLEDNPYIKKIDPPLLITRYRHMENLNKKYRKTVWG